MTVPKPNGANDKVFYLDLVGNSFLGRMARQARKDMYQVFLNEVRPDATSSILDVGVSVFEDHPEESNLLEQLYPYPSNIKMLGVHEGSFLEQRFPGTTYVRYDPQGNFPFEDGQFDVCYCNAVIEHVGLAEDRHRFLRELLRVAARCS